MLFITMSLGIVAEGTTMTSRPLRFSWRADLVFTTRVMLTRVILGIVATLLRAITLVFVVLGRVRSPSVLYSRVRPPLIKFRLVDGFVPDRRPDLRGQEDCATKVLIDPRHLVCAVDFLEHGALGQVRPVDPPLGVHLQDATLLDAVHDSEDVRNDRVLPAKVTRLVPLTRILGCRALTRLCTNQDLQRDVEGRREGLERVHEEVLGVRQVNLRQPRSHALDHQQLVETLLPVRHLVIHDLDNLLGRYAHRSRDLLDVGLLVHLEDRGLLRVLPEALAARAQDLLDRDQVVDARLQGRVTIHRPIKGPDNDARWVYLEIGRASCRERGELT